MRRDREDVTYIGKERMGTVTETVKWSEGERKKINEERRQRHTNR